MTEPVPVPVLNDGGDWWMLIEVGYTDSPDPVLTYCKVLQWERTVDPHGQPMIAAWLAGSPPVRSDRDVTQGRTGVRYIHRRQFVRLTRDDTERLRQTNQGRTFEF